jgi:hypothetical protein
MNASLRTDCGRRGNTKRIDLSTAQFSKQLENGMKNESYNQLRSFQNSSNMM